MIAINDASRRKNIEVSKCHSRPRSGIQYFMDPRVKHEDDNDAEHRGIKP